MLFKNNKILYVTARQAAKNTPKRPTNLTTRSPMESSSPGVDYSVPDAHQPSEDSHTGVCMRLSPLCDALFSLLHRKMYFMVN